ncbi:MAG: 2TM domain-containing protein [Dehalococcoidia bacterium]|nr:MAG: 2TM domain-containing protein [Dehalococcoidia bacterium]
MPDEHDDFEGIDISGPWGGVRIGSGRMRGAHGDFEGDAEYRAVRRRVRRRLDFYRHVATFAMIVGGLALIDWLSGGGWWVQWVAGIWGAILLLQFFSTFVSPMLWGREVEERMVRRELSRRRGRVSVMPSSPPAPGAEASDEADEQ